MPRGQTAAHRDSVGRPVACAELAIVDEHGCELPRGEAGEIWVAGPMVIPGYWRDAEATSNEFRAGYWCSGDIGSQDANGYVRVLDRRRT
jgi:long-subunit acyl-CoA synthetase (AMP-forming)